MNPSNPNPASSPTSLHDLIANLINAGLRGIEDKYLMPGTSEAVAPHIPELVKEYIPESKIPPALNVLGKLMYAAHKRDLLNKVNQALTNTNSQEAKQETRRQMSDPSTWR